MRRSRVRKRRRWHGEADGPLGQRPPRPRRRVVDARAVALCQNVVPTRMQRYHRVGNITILWPGICRLLGADIPLPSDPPKCSVSPLFLLFSSASCRWQLFIVPGRCCSRRGRGRAGAGRCVVVAVVGQGPRSGLLFSYSVILEISIFGKFPRFKNDGFPRPSSPWPRERRLLLW